jgi:hypothetical protein
MLDERPVIGRIGYRRHSSAIPCDHRHLDNRLAGQATVRRIVMATVAPSFSGFSCRLHGLDLLISDPFLGGFLGPEPGHHLQVTAGRLGFHLERLASIRVWDNPINCHAANMA